MCVCTCIHICGTFTDVLFCFQKQVLEKNEAARQADVETSAPTSKAVSIIQISMIVP